MASDGDLAVRAAALWVVVVKLYVVTLDIVPVANNQCSMATWTESGTTFIVVNIAGKNVMQTGVKRNLAGLGQGGGWRGRNITHFPVGMEGSEMERYIGAEFFGNPTGEFLDFLRAVILAGDEQGGDFQPATGFVVDVGEDVEDGLQVGDAELVIETVGEGLEINVGSIHHSEKFTRRFRVDVAGGYCHIANAQLAAGEGRVDGVFGEDHRIIVGVGNGIGTVAFGGLGNGLRTGAVHQAVHVFRLGDVPVLAELAGEVAAGGTEGKNAAAGVKMVEWLLLDGVDAEAGGAAVGGELHRPIKHLPDEAGAALAFVQLTVTRTEVALDATIGQGMPPAGGVVHGVASFHFLTV